MKATHLHTQMLRYTMFYQMTALNHREVSHRFQLSNKIFSKIWSNYLPHVGTTGPLVVAHDGAASSEISSTHILNLSGRFTKLKCRL